MREKYQRHFYWATVVIVSALIVIFAGFLAGNGDSIYAAAASGQESGSLKVSHDTEPLDCLSCHARQLAYHDQLGQGNQACWTCHVSTDPTMSTLHLANGTSLTYTETPRLCGQCHQVRYLAWQEGTHGVPGTVAAVPCTTCHDPHQPQMAFLGITKPPPPPLNFIVSLPREAAIITGIAIVFLLGLAIILARREDVL